MKKRIAALSFLLAISNLTPAAIAAPKGCPNEWGIPRNLAEASTEQIRDLYTPDFDTVLRPNRNMEFSTDGSTWTTVKNVWLNLNKPDQALQRNFDVGLLIQFFGSQWDDVTLIRLGDLTWLKERRILLRNSISVVKQGCPESTTFYWQREITPPGSQTLSFMNEIEKIKNRFRNFEEYESAMKKYQDCVTKWNSYGTSSERRRPLDTCYIAPIGRGGQAISLSLIPNQADCLEFLPGDANTASTVGVRPGSNCVYSILGFKGENFLGWEDVPSNSKIPTYYDADSDKLVFFGTIRIEAKISTQTINCVKGKKSRKVSGTKPKCPVGFKQK